ncbi:hypothetical protein AB0M41_31135 [Streptomyces sp. NPDC051896]
MASPWEWRPELGSQRSSIMKPNAATISTTAHAAQAELRTPPTT